MAAGDIQVYGPFPTGDIAKIIAGLSGNGILVADDMVTHVDRGMVYYTVVKAA